ncbi:unnamed protein product [Rhizoctonia solani]|uniref:Uncharacterized protein n=1 Tax=Rhizoctonia solani TaxID=456999 RepID=A0A8H2XNM3_9AGAM|nr:unnamed protein product [Rhizoctonia solani]
MQGRLTRRGLPSSTGLFHRSFRCPSTRYLSKMSPDRVLPLVAVDMDDVLCRTNETAAIWHNVYYGTNLTIADFHYYHYWKNPGWGSPTETLTKVREFSKSEYFTNTPPVEGAIEGVKALKSLGCRLEIVTARALRHQHGTDMWLNKYLPGVIDKVHYTGEFEHNPNAAIPPPPNGSEYPKKLTKADVLKTIRAKALIDDSLPNAMLCSGVVPVVLFGDYQWNKRPSFDETAQDRMSYSERQRWEQVEAKYRAEKNGIESKESDWNEWWERDNLYVLPPGINRAKSWTQVIEWFKSEEGRKALGQDHRRTTFIQPSEERVLIIGASSGVGRTTAVAYARRGARVAIVARRSAVLEQVKQDCLKAQNESGYAERKDAVLAVTADFSDEREMENVRIQVQRAWNGIDTVIVSAGVSALQPVMNLVNQGGVGRAVSVAIKAIEGNYMGPLVSIITMIPLLESSSKKPAVALISSLAAVVPAPTRAIYCSTKSAGLLLFQSLAIEHPRIKFSNIIPATIEGDFRASAVDGGDVREVLKGALSREEVAQAIVRAVDTEQRAVWMPRTMRFAPFLYWVWPGFVEKKARKKYNFSAE